MSIGDRLRYVREDLERYPFLYVQLRAALSAPVRAALSDKVTVDTLGPRTPEYTAAQDAMDTLTRIIRTWCGYAAQHRDEDLPAVVVRGREGRRFQQGVNYLRRYSEVLLAEDPLAEEYENDLGIGIRKAERALATDDVIARLPAPCPECNHRALIRHNGKDEVVCAVCRTTWSSRMYELLCRVLVAEHEGGKHGTPAGRR